MKLLNVVPLRPYLSLSLILSLSHAYAHNKVILSAENNPVTQHTLATSLSNEQLADKICAIICTHSLTKNIDAEGSNTHVKSESQRGFSELRKKLLEFITRSEPIVFTLIGFPFKSGNIEKNVLGSRPDKAERIALENMQKFMEEIQQIYPYGASLAIYTDGLAFYDLLGVPLENVLAYEKALKQLGKDLPHLSIVTLQDVFPDLSPKQIQKHIYDQNIQLKKLTRVEENVLSKRLSQELDYPQGKAILEKISLASLAEAMNQRSKKLTHLYKSIFPKSIHLSVHYQKDVGKKVGIALSASNLTPWHGVAVLNKEGSFSIMRKKDLSKDLKLSSQIINGIMCHYYIENK